MSKASSPYLAEWTICGIDLLMQRNPGLPFGRARALLKTPAGRAHAYSAAVEISEFIADSEFREDIDAELISLFGFGHSEFTAPRKRKLMRMIAKGNLSNAAEYEFAHEMSSELTADDLRHETLATMMGAWQRVAAQKP